MALTDTQKAKVRRYLGYPDVNRLFAQDLEGAMDSLSTEGLAVVVALLAQLDTLDTDLQGSWSRQKVTQAEEVKLAGFDEILALRDEGGRLCTSLAQCLDVVPRASYFTAGRSITGVAWNG